MKLIVLFVVCLCVFYVGYLYTNYHKKKLMIFCDLVKFCGLFESSVRFSKLTLIEIVNKYKNLFCLEFNNILDDYFIKMKPIESDFLSKEEIAEVTDFLSSLGKQDLIGEVENVRDYKTKFISMKTDIENINSKVGGLGIKLGILTSLLIFVIFV